MVNGMKTRIAHTLSTCLAQGQRWHGLTGLPLLVLLLPPAVFGMPLAQQVSAFVEREMQSCKSRLDTKVAGGLATIAACPCSDADKQLQRAQLRQAAAEDRRDCEIDALQQALDRVDQEKLRKMQQLEQIKSAFLHQIERYEQWQEDINQHLQDALHKRNELLLTGIVDILLHAEEHILETRLNKLFNKVQQYKDVRKAKQEDVKHFISSFRDELRGKSREQAKAIVLQRIQQDQTFIKDAVKLNKFALDETIKSLLAEQKHASADAQLQKHLEGAYALIMTATEIAWNHKVETIAKVAGWTGVLALAPDALDTAVVLWTAAVDAGNLQALDQLMKAANQQRQALAAELHALLQLRGQLERRKTNAHH